MKPFFTALFSILISALAVLATPPLVHAQPVTCPGGLELNWTMVEGQPGFCVGGFSSPDQLRSHSLDLVCTGGNCGGVAARIFLNLTGQDTTRLDLSTLSDSEIAQDGSSYYTCYGGDFSQEVLDVIQSNVDRQEVACVASLVGPMFVNPGLGLVARVALGGASCAITDAVFSGLPDLTLALNDPSGTEICTATVEINAQDASQNQLPDTPLGNYLGQLCAQSGPLEGECCQCVYGSSSCPENPDPTESTGNTWTAIGCIEASSDSIANSLITALLGIAGGFALVFLLYGAFKIATSASNPERLTSGRDTLIAAILGLLLIILSISILSFIGVDILQIPGF